ncbi:hypothetical protein [Kitasatospora aureofaciens]|uniref:hypothetical protein n=1 Tax=Kitasatospora aureofaciens TaxID=1894 RepID=UPI001C4705D1|nr:hypothetical protein [Kitasatospora aureofaciens]MBV6697308.1 hypothetical protein [Kitasatospora aureofaciens]
MTAWTRAVTERGRADPLEATMESAEHVWIGNQITLNLGAGRVSAQKLGLRVSPSAPWDTMTYGQGIALGGDFYGVVGAPISTAGDPEAAFRRA